MFGKFKKKVTEPVVAQVVATVKEIVNPTPMNEKVQQIHNAFDMAGDFALAEAKRVLDKEADKAAIERATKLKQLGFTSMQEVEALDSDESAKFRAQKKADTVTKYNVKYPQYKFIFESQVKEICEKYGLVCGTADMYKGTIPDKNIAEIAAFKVADEDTFFTEQYERRGTKYTKAHIIEMQKRQKEAISKKGNDYSHMRLPSYEKVPFYICAPEKDMKTNGHRKEGVMLIPDPIVLHWLPDGYLIVSKWGLEGQDPILVNEVMN